MPKLIIDNRDIEVEPGDTILDAARQLGLDIPTLCFREGFQPSTSCMVCVVKIKDRGKFVPSCATVAEEGMQVENDTEEVHEARRTALELLLSDHVGDCIAPCHNACPAQMDIPRMLRHIRVGELHEALVTVKEDIALPAVLGYICTAPCEGACRRRAYDSPASICLLKRHVAEIDLASEEIYIPSRSPGNGRSIGIVGTGPTGLSAAYYLLQKGYDCTLFDDHERPGGMLRYAVPEDRLPHDVLDAEIGIIGQLGAKFRMQTRIGLDLTLKALKEEYDALLIATGELEASGAETLGLHTSSRGIQVDPNTYQTTVEGIFAAGNAIRRRNKLAVRSAADGKAAAISIDQHCSGLPLIGTPRSFHCRIGKLVEGELEKFVVRASNEQRVTPMGGIEHGLSVQEARAEAQRCLQCDCRKANGCKLRQYAEIYEANPNRYRGVRRIYEHQDQHPEVIFEPGKCISCGLCIQIASRSGEELGLSFIGRGFDVKVGVPFNRSIAEGLRIVATECVAACPTGALMLKDDT